jgi:hypothetical protein
MGLFNRKKKQPEPKPEYDPYDMSFEMRCIGELAEISNNATTDDLIGLRYTKLEDYIAWRRENPLSPPRSFFYRPGAPDIKKIRQAYEEIIQFTKDKVEGKK